MNTGPEGHCLSGEFPNWVGTACRAVHRPLGFLAPTNVDRSTHAKRAQAKVEWHENRSGFSATNRSEMSPQHHDDDDDEEGPAVSRRYTIAPSSAPMIPVQQAS